MLQITSNPLGQVFEAMMENRQDQIPDEGFLMTKKRRRKKRGSKGPIQKQFVRIFYTLQ
jgi:hypothetical protein